MASLVWDALKMRASLRWKIPKDWNVFPEAMAVVNVPSFVLGNAVDQALLEQLKLNDENWEATHKPMLGESYLKPQQLTL